MYLKSWYTSNTWIRQELNIQLISEKYFRRFSSQECEKETGLLGYVYNFPIYYSTFDSSNFFDIHKYLEKKT